MLKLFSIGSPLWTKEKLEPNHVREGDSLVLNCRPPVGLPPPIIFWMDNGEFAFYIDLVYVYTAQFFYVGDCCLPRPQVMEFPSNLKYRLSSSVVNKQENMQPESMKPELAGDLNVSCGLTQWGRMERQGSFRENFRRSVYLQTYKRIMEKMWSLQIVTIERNYS